MNFFRRLLFSQASPLVKLAKTKYLEESDLLPLPEHLHPKNAGDYGRELKWESPRSLLLSSVVALRKYTIPGYTWYFVSSLFALFSPVLVNRFIGLVSAGLTQETLLPAMVYGVLLGFCGFISGLAMQHYFFNSLQAHQVMMNLMNEKLFLHSLKLSQSARQKNQVGDIVNYMSSDSDNVADFNSVVGDWFSNVLLMVGVVTMLFYYIGWSAFAALAVLLTLAPLTSYVAKKFTYLGDEKMLHRDRRVTLMTQAMNAIRVVKFFAWEKSVAKEVTEVREKELLARRRMAKAEVISSVGYLGVSSVVLFVALAVHVWRGQPLTAALIFTCISLFGLLEGPFGDISRMISRTTNAFVGAGRLLSYFQSSQVVLEASERSDFNQAVGLNLHHLDVRHEDAQTNVLTNVSVQIPAGSSLAVVGAVGTGKSTLLMSILGELTPAGGSVQFIPETQGRPRMAYVPQEAYIVNGSLLENLKFGEEVTSADIEKSLYLSCLQRDLQEWSGGLQTEIGEKGVNLSGGQKQRLALARAFLRKPQVVLLDDPLSAVDGATEDLLCERLLFGEWQNTTRIVATHRLEHLKRFDQILFVQDGKVSAMGTYEHLLKTSESFKSFYQEHTKSQGEGHDNEKAAHEAAVATTVVKTDATRVTEDEDREVGAVKSSVYWDYVSSLGGDNKKRKPWILALLAVGTVASSLFPLAQKSWLSYFTDHQSAMTPLFAIGIYGLLGIVVLGGSLLNHLFWLDRGIKAGKDMHNNMLASVLRAPIRFFDSTPVGRILQRFSRDVESVDIYLQWSFDSAIHAALQVTISILLIVTLMPAMIFVIIPVMMIYYVAQRDYRRPAREAKRMDSIARSPRFAHFKESLQGLVVIRSFNKTNWFAENFYQKLAHSNRMFYSHYVINRWFSSRIPMIGGLISMATAIGVSLSAYYRVIDAGTAGLVTLYSLSFWGYLNWGVRIFSDIESRMTSIERLKFFSNLPAEVSVMRAPAEPVRETWPEKGAIQVEGLKARYAAHLPLVLKGISFEVTPGSRVGIIGRTGSGKSTFFQSLFRFIEAEEGAIKIDGIDIATVELERLRRNLAIIPQDPTLFMGTIRSNLDRYEEYTDEEVIRALQHASMWDFVRTMPLQLQAVVTEGGANLSQGQRQLLCLARALLTEAKVIVMDEATASVDVQTDALVQKVIRTSFKGVTMLIIAHRLGTVADCDQIVEIAAGEVKSVRKPSELSKEEIEESIV